MIRLAQRDLWSHKLRTILTMLAILLGVAMISGTYVLTDQIDNGFNNIFDKAYQGTDVTVTRKAAFTGSDVCSSARPLPVGLLDQVHAVNGVADAAGTVAGSGAVVVNGKSVNTGGAPTLFFSVRAARASAAARTSPARVADARRQGGDHREAGHRQAPHSRATRSAWRPSRASSRSSSSGVFDFGDSTSLGGATLIATTAGRRAALVRPRGPVLEHRRGRRAGRHARHAGATPPGGAAALRRRQDRPRPSPTRPSRSATPSATSCARSCSPSAASPCSSAPSSSSTPSRSPWPSAPRVRHAARAGRLAPPGAGQRDRRGRRAGRRRLAARPARRPRRRHGHQRAVQGGRRRHPDSGHRAGAAHHRRRRSWSASS